MTFGIILQHLKWYLDNNIVGIRYQNSYNISGIILTYMYLSCYLYNKRQKKEKSAKKILNSDSTILDMTIISGIRWQVRFQYLAK